MLLQLVLPTLTLLLLCINASTIIESKTVDVVFEWVKLDFDFASNATRQQYIADGKYIVANNALTGLKVMQNYVFVTVPRWRSGVPSTLNYISKSASKNGALLVPFPSWEMNTVGNCDALQYVQSMEIDANGIMWVIDVGRVNIFEPDKIDNTCPPKLVRFDIKDMENVAQLSSYTFPDNVASHTASFLNDIVVDSTNNLAYISDAGTGAIIVMQYSDDAGTPSRSSRFVDDSTLRDPSIDFTIGNVTYGNNTFTTPEDGIALTPDGSRVFYNPLQGVHIYSVSTTHLVNFDLFQEDSTKYNQHVKLSFINHGQKQAPSDGMTFGCNGQLFYGGLTTHSLYSWNALTEHGKYPTTPMTSGVVVTSSSLDMTWIDTFGFDDVDSSLWFSSNHLDKYFQNTMDFSGGQGANFRLVKYRPDKGIGSYLHGPCVTNPNTGGGNNSDRHNADATIVALSIFIGLLIVALAIALSKWTALRNKTAHQRIPSQTVNVYTTLDD